MSVSFYRSSKGRLLFGLRGRISRADFWVGLAVVTVMTTLAVLLHGHRGRGGSLGPFFGVVAAVAMLSPYCLTALAVKRLHDLDRSGWHVLVLWAAFILGTLATLAYWGLWQDDIIRKHEASGQGYSTSRLGRQGDCWPTPQAGIRSRNSRK
jgi:uncharacterized membrane protein YhaH (DUF805 family)